MVKVSMSNKHASGASQTSGKILSPVPLQSANFDASRLPFQDLGFVLEARGAKSAKGFFLFFLPALPL